MNIRKKSISGNKTLRIIKIYIVLSLLILISFSSIVFGLYSSQPNIEWTKVYGDEGGETGSSVFQTLDGGYIVAGYKTPLDEDNCDILLIKTNHRGNIQWSKNFGGGENDVASTVLQLSDETYLIAGNTESYGSADSSAWLIKVDKNGEMLKDKIFSYGKENSVVECRPTQDGGFICVGNTRTNNNSDIWIFKLDNSLKMIWEKTIDNTDYDAGLSVDQKGDGDFVFLCTYSTKTYSKILLLATNVAGEIINEKLFGRQFIGAVFNGESIRITNDGGCIIGGYRNWRLDKLDFDYCLWKFDSNLNLEWEYYCCSEDIEMVRSVRICQDYGYIFVGNNIDSKDFYLIKVSESGNKMWSKEFGGDDVDMVFNLELTNDNSFIIVGYTLSYGLGNGDVWLIKLEGENTPPSLEIIHPKDGETVSDLVTINGSSSDPNGYATIEKVEIKIGDNGSWITATGTNSWNYLWDSSAIENGPIVIYARCFDGKAYSNIESVYLNIKNFPIAIIDSITPNPSYFGTMVSFKGHGIDKERPILEYNWSSHIDGELSTSSTFNTTFLSVGNHTINFSVKNEKRWSDMDKAYLEILPNSIPKKPIKPEGEMNGKIRVNYAYSTYSIDEDDDAIYYFFDWGDGTNSGWIGPFESGERINLSHSWQKKGSYKLRIRAKDEHQSLSNWSDPLEVAMPNYKLTKIHLIIQKFFDKHPYLSNIIQFILNTKF